MRRRRPPGTEPRPARPARPRVPPGRLLRIFGPWLVALAALVAYPWIAGASVARAGSFVAVHALVALSLTVITGWAGAVSLGQAAFVGLGAFAAAWLSRRGVPFAAWFPVAVAVSVPVSVVTGWAALRLPGLYFAVATLALGLAAEFLVLVPLAGDGFTAVARPGLTGIDFGDERILYLLVLLVVAPCFGAVLRIGRGRTGRALLAVRDSAPGAAALGIGPVYYRTLAFIVSGALATVAGVLLGVLVGSLRADAFTPYTSVGYLAAAVAGGLGSVLGAVFGGAVYHLPFEIAPRFAPLVLSVLLLAAVVVRPDGITGVLRDLAVRRRPAKPRPGRDAGLTLRRRRPDTGVEVRLGPFEPPPGVLAGLLGGHLPDPDAETTDRPVPAALELRSVSVAFGPARVLEDVSLRLEPGEIVGITGPSGAGKSTLLDVCSGFAAPAGGRILLDGGDVTSVRPAARVRAGLGRTFQSPLHGRGAGVPQLVSGLTVFENLLAGAHPRIRYGLPAEIIGFSYAVRDELAERERAGRLLDAFGLSSLAERAAGDLPPGLQQIVGTVRALAGEPSVLLLDEPAAGLVPSEAAWIRDLVRTVAGELGVAVGLVEREPGLAMDVCDYVYVLDAGRVQAAGRPGEVGPDALKPAGRG